MFENLMIVPRRYPATVRNLKNDPDGLSPSIFRSGNRSLKRYHDVRVGLGTGYHAGGIALPFIALECNRTVVAFCPKRMFVLKVLYGLCFIQDGNF